MLAQGLLVPQEVIAFLIEIHTVHLLVTKVSLETLSSSAAS